VTEIHDRQDVHPAQCRECLIREGSVEAVGRPGAELAHQLGVFPPAPVVPAALHLIHTQGACRIVGALFLMPVANMEKGAGGGASVGHTRQECKHGAQAGGDELRFETDGLR
jgi:hypothetical protein